MVGHTHENIAQPSSSAFPCTLHLVEASLCRPQIAGCLSCTFRKHGDCPFNASHPENIALKSQTDRRSSEWEFSMFSPNPHPHPQTHHKSAPSVDKLLEVVKCAYVYLDIHFNFIIV